MNCERTRQLLVEYLYGELPAEQAAEVQRELDQCPQCSAEYRELCQVREMMGAIPRLEVSPQIHANILREARLQASPAQAEGQGQRWAWLQLVRSPVAAAAFTVCLALVATFVLTRQGYHDSSQQAPVAVSEEKETESPVVSGQEARAAAPIAAIEVAPETAVAVSPPSEPEPDRYRTIALSETTPDRVAEQQAFEPPVQLGIPADPRVPSQPAVSIAAAATAGDEARVNDGLRPQGSEAGPGRPGDVEMDPARVVAELDRNEGSRDRTLPVRSRVARETEASEEPASARAQSRAIRTTEEAEEPVMAGRVTDRQERTLRPDSSEVAPRAGGWDEERHETALREERRAETSSSRRTAPVATSATPTVTVAEGMTTAVGARTGMATSAGGTEAVATREEVRFVMPAHAGELDEASGPADNDTWQPEPSMPEEGQLAGLHQPTGPRASDGGADDGDLENLGTAAIDLTEGDSVSTMAQRESVGGSLRIPGGLAQATAESEAQPAAEVLAEEEPAPPVEDIRPAQDEQPEEETMVVLADQPHESAERRERVDLGASQPVGTGGISLEALFRDGLRAFDTGEYAQSIQQLSTYLANAPPTSPYLQMANYYQGQAQMAVGNYYDANRNFQVVVQGSESFTHYQEALYLLARSYEEMGDFDQAEANYIRLDQQVNPYDEEVDQGLTRVRRARNSNNSGIDFSMDAAAPAVMDETVE